MGLELWAAVIGLAVIVPVVWLFNRLVAARNLARQGYADIDVQLKRRADLVPALVEAVKGYAAYEKALLSAVTDARSAALAGRPESRSRDLSSRWHGVGSERRRLVAASGVCR